MVLNYLFYNIVQAILLSCLFFVLVLFKGSVFSKNEENILQQYKKYDKKSTILSLEKIDNNTQSTTSEVQCILDKSQINIKTTTKLSYIRELGASVGRPTEQT